MEKMAQQSIPNYFNSRKRGAVEDSKLNAARKVLVLDSDNSRIAVKSVIEQSAKSEAINNNNAVSALKPHFSEIANVSSPSIMGRKKLAAVSRLKNLQAATTKTAGNIEQYLNNMTKNVAAAEGSKVAEDPKNEIHEPVTPTKGNILEPTSPTKPLSAMDKLSLNGPELSLGEIKKKMLRSSRLAELKASLGKFKKSEKRFVAANEKTMKLKELPALKNFRAIELEVNLSPTKPQSPQKQYLSPKKDTTARRNLFNLQSPTKNAVQMPAAVPKNVLKASEESLTLPYRYRYLAELFRAIDTVSQILHNRKETITFKKLKPAVEEMLKRDLTEVHLGQIKCLYPESFTLQWEKLREFGTGTRRQHWELVIIPQIGQMIMTSEVLLERRRKLFRILIEKVKLYHQEFLATLDPPLQIPLDKITRWHPLFDIEKVPDIGKADLPVPPTEEKFTTGSQVLEKARSLFNCNTRMEKALEKLRESQQAPKQAEEIMRAGSVLKGIPKALLEKVRQRQAAKALETMTRSTDKEKEVQLYLRLPEIARLTRNLFVSEKKSVLPIDLVLDKLCNSYRVFSTKGEMETYLKTIAKEVGEWLVFHEVRGTVFIKIAKSSDLSVVMTKLQDLAEQKKAE